MNRKRITERCAEANAKVAASEYTALIRSISLLPARMPGSTSIAASRPKTMMETYGVLNFGWREANRRGSICAPASE